MAHPITFTASHFDVSAERPNPVNPIAGEAVLNRLAEDDALSSRIEALVRDEGRMQDVQVDRRA